MNGVGLIEGVGRTVCRTQKGRLAYAVRFMARTEAARAEQNDAAQLIGLNTQSTGARTRRAESELREFSPSNLIWVMPAEEGTL